MRIDKTWGYEQILYSGEYCAKLLVYTKAIASSLHYHELKHETFFVSSGRFLVEAPEGQFRVMMSGDSIVLPPMTKHRIHCTEPGTICESSSRDDPNDCVRLIPSESV